MLGSQLVGVAFSLLGIKFHSISRYIAMAPTSLSPRLQRSIDGRQIVSHQNYRHASELVKPRGRPLPNKSDYDFDPDKPIPYFSSGLYKKDGFHRDDFNLEVGDNTPQIVIMVSLVVFMLYFFVLREENEWDERLSRDTMRIFSEEAAELKKEYNYNLKHGLPTSHLVDRMSDAGIPSLFHPPKLFYEEVRSRNESTDK